MHNLQFLLSVFFLPTGTCWAETTNSTPIIRNYRKVIFSVWLMCICVHLTAFLPVWVASTLHLLSFLRWSWTRLLSCSSSTSEYFTPTSNWRSRKVATSSGSLSVSHRDRSPRYTITYPSSREQNNQAITSGTCSTFNIQWYNLINVLYQTV